MEEKDNDSPASLLSATPTAQRAVPGHDIGAANYRVATGI